MKLLIASDLHGSSKYVTELATRIDAEAPDRIILLGDLLYHGPRNDLPDEYNTKIVEKILNKYADKIIAVRGNCDSEVDQYVLNFVLNVTYTMFNIDGLNIFITHGHHYNKNHMPVISSFDILLHGHTHIPAFEKIYDDKIYVNPGSVSMPRGDSDHSYLIYEDKTFTWKKLDGTEYKKEKVKNSYTKIKCDKE